MSACRQIPESTCTVGPRGHARVGRVFAFILKPRAATAGRPCKLRGACHKDTKTQRFTKLSLCSFVRLVPLC